MPGHDSMDKARETGCKAAKIQSSDSNLIFEIPLRPVQYLYSVMRVTQHQIASSTKDAPESTCLMVVVNVVLSGEGHRANGTLVSLFRRQHLYPGFVHTVVVEVPSTSSLGLIFGIISPLHIPSRNGVRPFPFLVLSVQTLSADVMMYLDPARVSIPGVQLNSAPYALRVVHVKAGNMNGLKQIVISEQSVEGGP